MWVSWILSCGFDAHRDLKAWLFLAPIWVECAAPSECFILLNMFVSRSNHHSPGPVCQVCCLAGRVCLLYRDILVLDKCGSPWTQIQRAATKRGRAFQQLLWLLEHQTVQLLLGKIKQTFYMKSHCELLALRIPSWLLYPLFKFMFYPLI